MQLMNCFLIVFVCSACVAAEEVCVWEIFNASCSADEVVFIETAFYGRMNNSRCFNVTENETECSVDFRLDIQKHLGLKQNLHFGLASEFFTKNTPKCVNGQPFLDITHRCTKLNKKEICVSETFTAECPQEYVIFIQSALYGRMRSSRCIGFDKTGLDCYANVQIYLERQCNGRSECRVLASGDQLKLAESSCGRHQKPYLEIEYTCVHGFSCPPFTPPIGANILRTSDGYQVTCPNDTNVKNLLCKGGSWITDPEKICPTNGRRTRAEDEYVDYPESHLRRNGATCNSEYDAYGEIDDGGYASYSEVRNTGP